MTFKETIEVNKKIMKLIRSKFPEEFPTGYPSPDYTYYTRLERDVEAAERCLRHAGKK